MEDSIRYEVSYLIGRVDALRESVGEALETASGDDMMKMRNACSRLDVAKYELDSILTYFDCFEPDKEVKLDTLVDDEGNPVLF